MRVTETDIAGVLMLEPRVWQDSRGFFQETWNANEYRAAGVEIDFVQDNHSRSVRGVLRGLHLQARHPQGKLVRVSRGRVYDVVADVRAGSPTYGRWVGYELSDENHRQLWIPPGLAHGFCTLSDYADFQYKCTDYYHPEDAVGIRWDCPTLGIDWPVDDPILSDADTRWPGLEAFAGVGTEAKGSNGS